MFESLLLPWQQIYHLVLKFNFSEQLLKFLLNFTLLKYAQHMVSTKGKVTSRNYNLDIEKLISVRQSEVIKGGFFCCEHAQFVRINTCPALVQYKIRVSTMITVKTDIKENLMKSQRHE